MVKANILIVDDDQDVLHTARLALKPEFSKIDLLDDPSKLPGNISRLDYDVIILDMNFRKGLNDGREGLYWLNRILEINPDAIVVLITAYAEIDLAVEAIKLGAMDFIMKPWKNQKLITTLKAALELGASRKTIRRLQDTQGIIQESSNRKFHDFIGDSPKIQRVRDLIEKVADTDASVLILGENGTGKELVARSIHRHSARKSNVFMDVDLGAIPATLFESELFGYVKGAFTDARENKTGKMVAADKGTLFLDEIGNLAMEGQSKLLRTLQSREVTPVGSTQSEKCDFRLICATNMPLYSMVDENTFRQDLLYRINTVEIKLPALRERPEDIPLLARHFFSIYQKKYSKPSLQLNPEILDGLSSYPWPGNIRELEHAMERAVILSDSNKISTSDIIPDTITPGRHGEARTLDENEKHHIQEILEMSGGNVTKAAEMLGLTRTALYRRLNKHGLQ